MKKLRGIGLLAIDSSRTRAYLDAMLKAEVCPAHAILMEDKEADLDFPPVTYFDNSTKAKDKISAMGVPNVNLNTRDIHNPQVLCEIKRSPTDVIIYSGPSGAILGEELLNCGKRFLHVHPGRLPDYRGSTTFYYSILEEGVCGASALFLDKHIDTGPILGIREYPVPKNRRELDHGYDPFIRSDLLVRILKEFAETSCFREVDQVSESGQTYFIMHPVLRHICILGK